MCDGDHTGTCSRSIARAGTAAAEGGDRHGDEQPAWARASRNRRRATAHARGHRRHCGEKRTRAQVGGEQSGHIIFPDLGLGADLHGAERAGGGPHRQTAAELAAPVVKCPQLLLNIRVDSGYDWHANNRLVQALAGGRSAWGHRPHSHSAAGTEPLLRSWSRHRMPTQLRRRQQPPGAGAADGQAGYSTAMLPVICSARPRASDCPSASGSTCRMRCATAVVAVFQGDCLGGR